MFPQLYALAPGLRDLENFFQELDEMQVKVPKPTVPKPITVITYTHKTSSDPFSHMHGLAPGMRDWYEFQQELERMAKERSERRRHMHIQQEGNVYHYQFSV